jgi:hypothetical protein
MVKCNWDHRARRNRVVSVGFGMRCGLSVCNDESFNLDEEFFAAEIALEVEQVTREKKWIVKDLTYGIEMLPVPDVHLES